MLKVTFFILVISTLLATAISESNSNSTDAPITPDPFNGRLLRRNEFPDKRTFVGFEKPKNKSEFKEFTFIHATDPQFGLIEYFKTNKKSQDQWDIEQQNLAKAVKEWNNMKPTFVIISGDLVNAFPNNNQSELRKKQLESLKEELEKLDKNIPLILMPGNHDIGDEPTQDYITEYNKLFGQDYFSFYINNVKFIVLNTQYYKSPNALPDKYAEQNKWLSNELQDNDYYHIIVIQHIPWFINNIDTNNNETDWAKIPKAEAINILNELKIANVTHIFSGHFHQNAEGIYNDTVNMIVTSALGYQADKNTHSGYRIVNVRQKIEHKYHSLGNSADISVTASSLIFISIFIMIFSI